MQRHVIRIIYYTDVCDDNDDHDSGQMGFDLMKFNLQKRYQNLHRTCMLKM